MPPWRKTLVFAAVSLAVLHSLAIIRLGMTREGSLVSNLIQLAAWTLGVVVCLAASRRVSGMAREFWQMIAAGLTFWVAGQVIYMYYENYLNTKIPPRSIADLFFFAFYLPLTAVIFLRPQENGRGINWLRTLDYAQVGIVFSALYMYFLVYRASLEESRLAVLRQGITGVYDAANIVVVVGFLLRAWLSDTRMERSLYGRLAAALALYAVGDGLNTYGIEHWQTNSGSWLDFAYSLPPLMVAVTAARWQPPQEVPRADGMAAWRRRVRPVLPVIAPITVLFLAAGIVPQNRVLAYTILTASFICYSVRLGVTQHREHAAAEAQRQSHNLLHAIVEGTSDAIFVKDRESRYRMINTAGATFVGSTPEQIVGKDDSQIFHPQMGRRLMEEDRRVMQSGESESFEEVLTTQVGTRTYLTSRSPYRDAAGNIIGVMGIARDISARTVAEQALRLSEAKFRALAEASPSAIVILQEDRIRYANPGAARVTGYPADLLCKMKWTEIVHPDFHAMVARYYDARSHGEQAPANYEVKIVTRLGEQRWLESNAAPVEFERRPAVLSTAVDISERKRAEEDLRHSLSLLRATLESTDDGILVVDQQGRVVSYNQRFVDLWRIPASVMESREDDRMLDYVLEQLEDPEAFLRKVRELYGNLEAESHDVLNFRDGRTFERYSRPQRIDGSTVGRVWSFRDVSEEKRLEAQLRQSQKMEAVGTLAGGVAHDFNNLLTVITGYSRILLDKLERDPQLANPLQQIEKAAHRASALTRQLLAFSRRQVLQPRALNLNEVVMGMEKMLRRLIGEDVDLLTHTTENLGLVMADPGQLEQVLMNLAVNARDAMPNGGKLTFSTSDVQLDAESAGRHLGMAPGRYVLLAVSDTGCGMDSETQAHIFEPFFTTKKGSGTGLGLSTVYGIVQQSDGYISVESAIGRGTIFRIYLPRVETPARPVVNEAVSRRKHTGHETLLLVEDDDSLRELSTRILKAQGYKLLVAAGAREAEKLCSGHDGVIHLLVTDVIMPGESGRDLAARVLEMRPKTKVLYMSGYTDKTIARHGVLEPGIAFLQKPFSPSALAEKVREVLDAAPATK